MYMGMRVRGGHERGAGSQVQKDLQGCAPCSPGPWNIPHLSPSGDEKSLISLHSLPFHSCFPGVWGQQ